MHSWPLVIELYMCSCSPLFLHFMSIFFIIITCDGNHIYNYFFWNLPQSLTKHSGHCSCLTNIGSLPKGNNWQLGHKEFTVVHKIIKLIFYVPLRSDISKYFLILGEINSGSQTRRRTKWHTQRMDSTSTRSLLQLIPLCGVSLHTKQVCCGHGQSL